MKTETDPEAGGRATRLVDLVFDEFEGFRHQARRRVWRLVGAADGLAEGVDWGARSV